MGSDKDRDGRDPNITAFWNVLVLDRGGLDGLGGLSGV